MKGLDSAGDREQGKEQNHFRISKNALTTRSYVEIRMVARDVDDGVGELAQVEGVHVIQNLAGETR